MKTTLGTHTQCLTCRREFTSEAFMGRHACSNQNVNANKTVVREATRYGVEEVGRSGIGDPRELPAPPLQRADGAFGGRYRGGWACNQSARRSMPIPVREWLFEQYVESIRRDPKHPITSEAAFDALRRVRPRCPSAPVLSSRSPCAVIGTW